MELMEVFVTVSVMSVMSPPGPINNKSIKDVALSFTIRQKKWKISAGTNGALCCRDCAHATQFFSHLKTI